ncbi:MAG: bacteriohopanetetrol glucosamine biosynthesis glycosyltransferase HpnI [Bryobacterales bacterium]|jgi:ceramide glucosyltransferase|nr:bacteriohopanetetrol glucosamine biosynthesis glycosyltransferase HpnI [Bryobacterales bacterium]
MQAFPFTWQGILMGGLWTMAAVSALYQLLSLVAGIRHALRVAPPPSAFPAISVLKPMHGLDLGLDEALASFAAQDYPEFEVLLAVDHAEDPAAAVARRVMAAYPAIPMRLLVGGMDSANRKVGLVAAMEAQARHPVVLISDADITVGSGYLRAVATELQRPGVGLVTALYRARANTFPGWWEALGIATDFSPSALVGRMLGVSEFALGSTMALRKDLLQSLGGSLALGEYIADDYHLGRMVRARGLRIGLLREAVETSLSGDSWGEIWRHQLRWARTIRASRPDGYIGLPVTSASLWASLLLVAGEAPWGITLLALRLCVGAWLAWGLLGFRGPRWMLLLQPLRDCWFFAVWCVGLFGATVEWRGQQLVLNRAGRILIRRTS